MYSSAVRLQNVFGYFTTVVFVVAAFIAASDLLAPRTPSVGILKPTNVQVYVHIPNPSLPLQHFRPQLTPRALPQPSVRGRPHYYSSKKEEYAIIKFSLDADLSSLFTWNTKQLFVYVTVEWPSAGGSGSGQNATNQAVIWDSIITSPSADHLANLGPVAMKKLRRSAQGKSIDPSRYVACPSPCRCCACMMM
jgi:hypothetical protein